MEQSVVVSADQIAKSILDEGKAVFYGLYFDTDKAVLKPESGPTLVEMAKWLKDNPKNKVYIVGHTDMQGATDHNVKLSKARGTAVVEALATQHGIARERLAGEGVGAFAPMSNNTSEAGRWRASRGAAPAAATAPGLAQAAAFSADLPSGFSTARRAVTSRLPSTRTAAMARICSWRGRTLPDSQL
jgi:outer membrane protein OmpA-like peptidoglycan-associated protein